MLSRRVFIQHSAAAITGALIASPTLARANANIKTVGAQLWSTVAGGADPVKYLDKNAGRFKLMHVKDMSKPVRFSGDGGDPQQWIELFPYIKDAGSGVMDLKSILSHAIKSGVEHFIVENDVIVNPRESLQSAYGFVTSVR